MSFRTTLAIETRLSSSRPLILRRSSWNRSCLLSHLPALLKDTRPRLLQRRYFPNTAGPLKAQDHERKDGDRPPSSEEPPVEGPDFDSDFVLVQEFRRWKRAFNGIFHGTEAERKSFEEDTLLATEQRATALRFAARRFPDEIREQWNLMSETVQRSLLPDILIGSLLTSAELTLRILDGLPSLWNDFTIRMDCLMKLRREERLWSEIQGGTQLGLLRLFRQQLVKQASKQDLPRYELNAFHSELILEHCSYEQSSRFFEYYLATYPDRHYEVLISFVDHFTRCEDHEQALRAMRLIPPSKLEASEQHLLERCTNLLKLDTIDVEEESKNFRILPQLLELGIKPDTIIHNMIIMNAIRFSVHRVGWDLYEYLQAEKLETDSVTHLLLMKDAFARQDISSLNEILSAIHKRKDLYHDSYLVGCTMNIIRVIHTYEKRSHPTATFSHILNVHNRAWKPDIYIDLQMIKRSETTVLPDTDLRPPPPDALAWTICQYCLIQTNPAYVDRLWELLKRGIEREEPQILSAAAHESLYGGFIVFYGRNPRTLGQAVDIVQYLLDSEHCHPTAPTWMRLMGGYLRQGQYQEAEQIRQCMLRQGIKPKSKEFAWLLEHWPDTEVSARARRAAAGENTLPDQRSLDEELYEGLPAPYETAHPSHARNWNDMVDPWNQTWSAETPEDAETMKQLGAAIQDVRERKH